MLILIAVRDDPETIVELCRELFAFQLLGRRSFDERKRSSLSDLRRASSVIFLSVISCQTGQDGKSTLSVANEAGTVADPTNRTVRLDDPVLVIENVSLCR